jgi:hypothetical protein
MTAARRDLVPRVRRRLRLLGSWIATPADLWLATRMVGWKLVLPVLKYVLPLSALARLMWSKGRREPSVRRERQIAGLAQGLYGPRSLRALDNCLERSLVGYRFLSQSGSEPRLVVGIDKAGEPVKGHAWLTIRGEPVGELPADLEPFIPVVAFGRGGVAEPLDAQPLGFET